MHHHRRLIGGGHLELAESHARKTDRTLQSSGRVRLQLRALLISYDESQSHFSRILSAPLVYLCHTWGEWVERIALVLTDPKRAIVSSQIQLLIIWKKGSRVGKLLGTKGVEV